MSDENQGREVRGRGILVLKEGGVEKVRWSEVDKGWESLLRWK